MGTRLPFELYVALRYLLARRKQAFISLISFVSTLGVAVGVMALVIALALMTGLQGELRDRIVGSAAHVYVWKLGDGGISDYETEARSLRSVAGVRGAAPAMLGKALINTERAEAFITLKGIDPQLERGVTEVERAVQSGRLDELSRASGDGPEGIAVGRELANQLGVAV
jgi:lipoprotein-releasing system permease protein